MTRYVLANWKSYKTLPEAEKWFGAFLSLYRPDPQVRVIIAPSFVHLAPLRLLLQDQGASHLALAAQDLSPFPLGAYTGAVAAAMVRDLVDYAIVGHAERRRYFHETNRDVANKVSEAGAAGIAPIVCIDEPYAKAQFAALNETDRDGLLVGYGPVEAIGIDMPQSPEEAGKAVRKIQALAPGSPILYGGSIRAANAGVYGALAGVSGLMVGAASLDPAEFADICRIVSRS